MGTIKNHGLLFIYRDCLFMREEFIGFYCLTYRIYKFTNNISFFGILHITLKVVYTFFKKNKPICVYLYASVFICVHLCSIVVSKVSTINERCHFF